MQLYLRLPSYLHNSEKKLIFNSTIKSQFSYCPLVWMFCWRTSNIINKLHERSLGIILNDYSRDFNILLENNDICNHHRNIQALLTEVFKMKNGLAPPIMEPILNKKTLCVVTIAMIYSTLASLWKFQYFRMPTYNPVEHLWWSFPCGNSKPLSTFTKKLHRR